MVKNDDIDVDDLVDGGRTVVVGDDLDGTYVFIDVDDDGCRNVVDGNMNVGGETVDDRLDDDGVNVIDVWVTGEILPFVVFDIDIDLDAVLLI